MTVLNGCGGGGGSSSDSSGPVSDSYVFPAGKATLTFTAMSSAQLPTSIGGIDFTVTLPQGMSATTTGGVSGQIDSSTISAGTALAGTNLVFGSYSTSTRKAHLVMSTTGSSYRSGEFMRLVCTVASSTSITLADVKALNNPVNLIKAAGLDSSNTTVNLTSSVKVTIGAVK